MILHLPASTDYARTSTSQSSIGTAASLGFKVRVPGSVFTSRAGLPVASGNIVDVSSGSSTLRVELLLQIGEAAPGMNILGVVARHSSFANATCGTGYNLDALDPEEDYIILCTTGSVGWEVHMRRASDGAVVPYDDSLLGPPTTQAPGVQSVPNSNATLGRLLFGSTNFMPALPGWMVDGLAVYNAAPPDDVNEPADTDTGILWYVPFSEPSGSAANVIAGATAMDTFSAGAARVAGGAWEGPGGGTPDPDLLSTEDVALDFFLGEPALTQAVEIATESSASDLTFSELILTPHHALEIEALSFAPIVEAPILHQDIGLSAASIAFATRIDTPTLAQSIEAALQPLTFGLFLGTPAPTVAGVLGVLELSLDFRVENATLAQEIDAFVQGLSLSTRFENPGLIPGYQLTPQGLLADIQFGGPVLVPGYDLQTEDLRFDLTTGELTLTTHLELAIGDLSLTVAVEALVVRPENWRPLELQILRAKIVKATRLEAAVQQVTSVQSEIQQRLLLPLRF